MEARAVELYTRIVWILRAWYSLFEGNRYGGPSKQGFGNGEHILVARRHAIAKHESSYGASVYWHTRCYMSHSFTYIDMNGTNTWLLQLKLYYKVVIVMQLLRSWSTSYSKHIISRLKYCCSGGDSAKLHTSPWCHISFRKELTMIWSWSLRVIKDASMTNDPLYCKWIVDSLDTVICGLNRITDIVLLG